MDYQLNKHLKKSVSFQHRRLKHFKTIQPTSILTESLLKRTLNLLYFDSSNSKPVISFCKPPPNHFCSLCSFQFNVFLAMMAAHSISFETSTTLSSRVCPVCFRKVFTYFKLCLILVAETNKPKQENLRIYGNDIFNLSLFILEAGFKVFCQYK